MEKKIEIPTVSMLRIAILTLVFAIICHVSMAQTQNYIILMDNSVKPTSFVEHALWYQSSLDSVSESKEKTMLYAYDHVFNGFAASLTEAEAQKIKSLDGVLDIMMDTKYDLHTTRIPQFLGLDRNPYILPKPEQVSNVFIGVLDTGVWPESPSFNDKRMSRVPESWKGTCEEGANFTKSMCNKKLVGARFFSKGYETYSKSVDWTRESKSPRDDDGHGTHTSSTAGGSAVSKASLFGYAEGTALGMATNARIAMYKVCWAGGCFGIDILAGMEAAIKDNVDILSLSLGGGPPLPYYLDSIAIGAFAAMQKGIFVSCSAGNQGPKASSLANVAPWITTVGAGTLDRDFPASVKLGSGTNYFGLSLYKGDSLPSKLLPFVYAGNVSNNATTGNLCLPGTLIPKKVKGKIVLCDRGINARVEKGENVKAAGGAAMVLANTAIEGEELVADAHLLPATAVGLSAATKIKNYLFSTPNPTATIHFQGTRLNVEPSPVVAAFSLRGPNPINPEILKPDLIAPGVNILAGWTGKVGPTGLSVDKRIVKFNIISGTSMSCPVVSGLAALLKAAHPEWSPAAIRSALMTTAYSTDKKGNKILDASTGKEATPFGIGSGHANPISALNPGLVYNLTKIDYLNFLCALNYTPKHIQIMAVKTSFLCKPEKYKYSANNLNYPSFAVSLQAKKGSKGVVHQRTLTNVGPLGTYKVVIHSPETVKMSVFPQTLTFSGMNEKHPYSVTFSANTNSTPSEHNQFGSIEWSDGKHVVRSPVAVTWV